MRQSNVIAHCGMMAALSIVLMLLGAVLGLGLYISPMLAGLCLIPVGKKFGPRYQCLVWGTVSLLSFILVAEMEQNLMYCTLFGLYPILQPCFAKLPRRLIAPAKLLYFNLAFGVIEALAVFLFAPGTMNAWMFLLLMLLGNAIFLMYDFLLPRAHILYRKYFSLFRR